MILAAPIILSSLSGTGVENGEWIPHIFIEMTFKTKWFEKKYNSKYRISYEYNLPNPEE